MKKAIYTACLFIFCLQICSAQETKEDFLNEVRKALFDSSYENFNLSPEAECIWNNYSFDKKEVKKQYFPKWLSVGIVDELYINAKDTVTEDWSCDKIKGADCITVKDFKIKLSKNSILESDNEWKRSLYYISKPVFSNNKEWVIISVRGFSTKYGGFSWGDLYLFHKINGKWEKHTIESWIT